MADVKISALPASTTPLAGTEVLPIVQSGVTKKTSIESVLTSVQPSGTANGVTYLNGSKVLTSGSALTFDGTNLGIGISPAAKLDVSASSGTLMRVEMSGVAQLNIGNGGNSINYYDANTQIFRLGNGSEQMRLTSTGLGIGTSSPGASLHAAGAISSTPTGSGFLAGLNGTYGQAKLYGSAGGILDFGASGADASARILSTNAGDDLQFYTNGPSNLTEKMRLDSSGNLGLGVIPYAWVGAKALQVSGIGAFYSDGTTYNYATGVASNALQSGASTWIYRIAATGAARYEQLANAHAWYQSSGTPVAGGTISFTQAMTLDASGNLLVGTTSQPVGTYRFVSSANGTGAAGGALFVSNQATTGSEAFSAWHTATSGDNTFCYFGTEASFTVRGSITYNRGAGLTSYNVTSDYRAKDIIGLVADSGAVIDSVPVYMGKMKGATQERPMFIAHETPEYAHTGEKDAVDADGNPVYQQMDASALIPVMWAEIQSLRQRLAAAGI